MHEMKKILIKLLVASPSEEQVALVTSDHLAHMRRLLEKHTHHLYRYLSIEQSNYQSVLNELDEFNSQSNTILCELHVAGKLSPVDFTRLIERTQRGSVRLVVLYSPQMLYHIQLTGNINQVLIPLSLRKFSSEKVLAYDDSSLAGRAILKAEEIFSANPTLLNLTHELEGMKEKSRKNLMWKDDESKWRQAPFCQEDHTNMEKNTCKELYGLIVCEDIGYITHYYEEQGNTSGRIKILNASKSEEISVYLGQRKRDMQTISPEKRVRSTPRKSPVNQETSQDNGCIVVMEAHLLSSLQRNYLASNVISEGSRLILVVPNFNAEYLKLEFKEAGTKRKRILEVNYDILHSLNRFNEGKSLAPVDFVE
jgi:hypothetical protein